MRADRPTTPLDRSCKSQIGNQMLPGGWSVSTRLGANTGPIRPLSAQSTTNATSKLSMVLSSNPPSVPTLRPPEQSEEEAQSAGQDWVRRRPTHSGVGQPKLNSWGKVPLTMKKQTYSWQTPALNQGRPFRYFSNTQAHVLYV